ncbi:MAG: tRNA pseudouridine(38-40) synthase TruA [Bacteroidales bacterium]|nr:tRNA pseudouridine(38-40) synthase TruA [Bacteroidales bacterium]
MRFFANVSYNGERYSGWQRQPNAVTVQQILEEAMTRACGCPIALTGAGRTDAGVSASGYFAHFDCPSPVKEPAQLLYKINAILPADIVANYIAAVADDAHARFDATSRSYSYKVHTAKDPFAWHSFYCKFPLDVDAMNRAADLLHGRRDFSCFEKTGADNKTSVCNISHARWSAADATHLQFDITADRFLRNMVRAIVGTLIDVGRGKMAPEDIPALLEKGDRSAAGQSVPGEPLLLREITYPYPLLPL